MWTIINLILLIIFGFLCLRILSGAFVNKRTLALPDYPGLEYIMDPKMFFIIFLIITGPFYLSPFSLFKYGIFFVIMIYLLITKQIRIPKNIIVITYIIFIIWLFIAAYRIGFSTEAIMTLIKYILPLFALGLGYSAIENKYDLYYLMKIAAIGAVLYVFTCGGIANKLAPWLLNIFSHSTVINAGITDYLSSLSAIPLLLWWWTGNKNWFWAFLIIFSSPILGSVRTGLGAITISSMIFCFLKFKWKSLPFLFIILVTAISIIIFVPQIREKFYGDDEDVTNETIMSGESLSLDKMHTSGRAAMWEMSEDALYKGHELCGSGLGESTRTLRMWRSWGMNNFPTMMHNDYIQIKCDTGLIGLWLFILFGAVIFIYIGRCIWNLQDMTSRLCGILALASSGATAFSMGFDNVVSHSMSSMIMPFLFIGFFLKLYPQDNDEIINEEDQQETISENPDETNNSKGIYEGIDA